MRGAITNARIEGDAIVQTFGDGAVRHLSPPPVAKNYIYWRGGSLAFGKLTMTATDLELVDMDPKDPFDFSVEHWNDAARRGLLEDDQRARPEGAHARLQRSRSLACPPKR